jgi:YspA, cpYpsA-related SLOG family
VRYLGVTGWRDWDKPEIVHQALEMSLLQGNIRDLWSWPLTIIHGDCDTGVDKLTDDWAVANHLPVIRYRADWYGPCRKQCHHRPRAAEERCPAAGPYRNQELVQAWASLRMQGVAILAFPQFRLHPGQEAKGGTQGTMRLAAECGLLVHQIDYQTGQRAGYMP